ncbi:hypothetical protein [Streptomyces yangpuensis]
MTTFAGVVHFEVPDGPGRRVQRVGAVDGRGDPARFAPDASAS